MSMACTASLADATTPVSTIVSPTGTTLIGAGGHRGPQRPAEQVEVAADIDVEIGDLAFHRRPCTTTLVCPSAWPMTKILRVERTMALATLGLATNTSLASRGRSTISDLPMPISTRRDWPSRGDLQLLRRGLRHRGQRRGEAAGQHEAERQRQAGARAVRGRVRSRSAGAAARCGRRAGSIWRRCFAVVFILIPRSRPRSPQRCDAAP